MSYARRLKNLHGATAGNLKRVSLTCSFLQDVGDEPGTLPLLSHALLETWKRRQGHRRVHKSGRLQRAIARTAEAVFNGLSSEQQTVARTIFLRLTERGKVPKTRGVEST